MRRASNERPIRTQCKGDPQLPPARKGKGWIFGPESPETTASGCSRDHNPPKKPLAEAETPNPLEAQNHSQVLVLASIDLRSQHGRLVSARFNASVRKGVQGSCKRAASQAAGRAYRIVLQRSRPRRGEKEGSKGLPGQNFSKGLFSLLPRHGVHRDIPHAFQPYLDAYSTTSCRIQSTATYFDRIPDAFRSFCKHIPWA